MTTSETTVRSDGSGRGGGKEWQREEVDHDRRRRRMWSKQATMAREKEAVNSMIRKTRTKDRTRAAAIKAEES